MKKILLLSTITAIVSLSGRAQQAEWKEMHDFHVVMSGTFHPAEEGKLDPIRNRSQEMVDKATAWQKSSAPAGYNKKGVEKSLGRLVEGSEEINKMVKEKAGDKELFEKLNGLHDVFHEIMEKCRKPE